MNAIARFGVLRFKTGSTGLFMKNYVMGFLLLFSGHSVFAQSAVTPDMNIIFSLLAPGPGLRLQLDITLPPSLSGAAGLRHAVDTLNNLRVLPDLSSEVDEAERRSLGGNRFRIHTVVRKWGRHHTVWLCTVTETPGQSWTQHCALDPREEDNHNFFQRASGEFTEECIAGGSGPVTCSLVYQVIPNSYATKSVEEMAGLFVENTVHDNAGIAYMISNPDVSASDAKRYFESSSARRVHSNLGRHVTENYTATSLLRITGNLNSSSLRVQHSR